MSMRTLVNKMETIICRQCAVAIELTARQDGWTISGKPDAVNKAVRYVTTNGAMILETKEYDEELGETFAYLRDGPALGI